ncbi:sugar ABC transporter substrate-binding protein [Aeromicrobium fastidiosum]|uniref:sugar ABC transporter substrate-binding protein n=1 Tax=Aeromicrobium fastidiosum TaxID=52699 RepID=UPI00165FA7CA|nr:substrate-binding domain-containing protein [Aeromicrobium fastidiosum]MBP2389397.1 ABC-type sugar transport system substrate-binding protein [Aeromicrobium fastidiosum]
MRKTTVAVVAVAAGSLLAACGGSGSSEPTGAKGGTDEAAVSAAQTRLDPYQQAITKISQDVPLTAKPAAGKLVYEIHNNVPVAAQLTEPYEKATAALGWKLKTILMDPTDPQAPSNALKQAVAAGADYIGISAASGEAMSAGLAVTKKAGIPVFLEGGPTATVPEGKKNGLYSNGDHLWIQDATFRLLDEMIVDSKGAGDVLLLSTPDYPALAPLAGNAKKSLAKSCPKCAYQSLDISVPDLIAGSAPQSIVAALRKNSDITYVVAPFDALALGLPEAMKSAGIKGVKLLLGSPDPTQVPGLAKGTFMALAPQPVESVVWANVDQMARYSLGMDLLVDQHALEPYPVWSEKNPPAAGQTDYAGPDDYESQWKALWKIS